jgi:ubiquinone biosynthesis protein Coq4
MIKPAMQAITDGWTAGSKARSLQFVKFEHRLAEPLEALRAEYRLVRDRPVTATPRINTPDLMVTPD